MQYVQGTITPKCSCWYWIVGVRRAQQPVISRIQSQTCLQSCTSRFGSRIGVCRSGLIANLTLLRAARLFSLTAQLEVAKYERNRDVWRIWRKWNSSVSDLAKTVRSRLKSVGIAALSCCWRHITVYMGMSMIQDLFVWHGIYFFKMIISAIEVAGCVE